MYFAFDHLQYHFIAEDLYFAWYTKASSMAHPYAQLGLAMEAMRLEWAISLETWPRYSVFVYR